MPSKRPSATRKGSFIDQILSPTGIIFLIIIFLALSGGMYFYARRATFGPQVAKIGKKTPTPKPTPTPIKLIPDDGVKGTFTISTGKQKGAKFEKVILNPLDVQKGNPLTITIKLSNSVPITEVKGRFEMDHSIQELTFPRIDGTDLNGTWELTIPSLPDSVQYTYIIRFVVVSENGTVNAGIAPRSL